MPDRHDGVGTLALDPGYDNEGNGAPEGGAPVGWRYRRNDAEDGRRLYIFTEEGAWVLIPGAL